MVDTLTVQELQTGKALIHRQALMRPEEFGEKVLYQRGNVMVTQTRFVVSGQTYAIRNLTSVEAAEVRAGLNFGVFLLVTVGVFVAIIGSAAESPVAGLIGAAIAALGFYFHSRRKLFYAVALRTSGGEVRAIVDKDQSLILEIVASLNRAIISR